MRCTAIRNALAAAGALVGLALGGCACTSRGSAGTGNGSGSAAPTGASICERARARAESLYRAEAAAQTPPGTDEEVADNVAMVVADCHTDPALVAACAARADSVPALERDCLIRIDDEGSEGRQFLTR